MRLVPHLVVFAVLPALAVLWLALAHRRLGRLRGDAVQAERELVMHRALSAQAKGGPNAAAAEAMLETSRSLYRAAAQSYNSALKRLGNRLPALILGYRPIGDDAP